MCGRKRVALALAVVCRKVNAQRKQPRKSTNYTFIVKPNKKKHRNENKVNKKSTHRRCRRRIHDTNSSSC